MFIVITKSTFSPDIEQDVMALAKQSGPIARAQPGLNAMTMHRNHERPQLMTYWSWARREDHDNCMASDEWQAFMPKWNALIEAGKLQFEMETYDRLDY